MLGIDDRFQKGEALEKLIREARFSIYPSEWYENCPFSVMESQMYGTPVLGADIGGMSVIISYAINFLVTPYITENLGVEAYSFVSIANTAVNYARDMKVKYQN